MDRQQTRSVGRDEEGDHQWATLESAASPGLRPEHYSRHSHLGDADNGSRPLTSPQAARVDNMWASR